MENIVSHLKLTESKQRNLFKAHEQLHSEASSFLLFSLQWKDLEQHFDSTRDLILRQYQDLEHRENCFSSKEKQLGHLKRCIDECDKEFESKKNELGKLNSLIERNNAEVNLKLGRLLNDIKLKEREFHAIRKKNDDCKQELVRNEQKLNGIVQLIEERSKECVSKEKVLESLRSECVSKEKVLESLRSECVSKERDLESVRTLIQEQEEGLANKMKQYDSLQMAIKESSVVLKLKGKELESIQNMIATILKEKRLDTLEKTINLRSEQLDFKEKELGLMLRKSKDLSGDLSSKESELDSIKLCIKEHSKELDMLEKQLVGTQNSIKDCQNEVICLAEYVSLIEEAIIECSKECESKENLFDSLQTSVDSDELASMEKPHNSISMAVMKCLEGLKVKKEHFYLLGKSIEDRSQKLKIKENELERQTVELNKKDEKVSKILKEIELVKIEVDSQMKLLEKSRDEQRLEEKFTEKAKSVCNSNIHPPSVKTEESDCEPAKSVSSNTLNFHSRTAIEGNFLLALLCEQLKAHDFVRTDLTSVLQTSSHPAKSVLDAMRWFYPAYVVTEDTKCDVQNVKMGCILLSELMLKVSPKITPPLKEAAFKLALQWKHKMTLAADNHLEVVAFLLLVANFGLSRDFNADELHILLNSVSHYPQIVELGRALGIADKSPESSTGRYSVKMEQAESSSANCFLHFKRNFVMNEMSLNLSQLFNELQTYESIRMKDKNNAVEENVVFTLGANTKKRKMEFGKKNKDKTVAGHFKKLKKEGKIRKHTCYYCHVDGHWKRNCPKYLEDMKRMETDSFAG